MFYGPESPDYAAFLGIPLNDEDKLLDECEIEDGIDNN